MLRSETEIKDYEKARRWCY